MCIFSSYNDRQLKKLRKILTKINDLESHYAAMTDVELKAMTPAFKAQLAEGATLTDLLPDAFAVVRETSKRVLGMRHFDVQILGGIVLHQGRIAEMATGEGKTLVSTLPAYLNALTGKGVHVVTVNDYLAKRDAEWMGKIYAFLGLTVGVVYDRMGLREKQAAYACDVVYATNHAFGFDYLRDNMAKDKSLLVQRELYYAIIDEVDSILIDEARTPLIISGPTAERTEMYLSAHRFAKTCTPDDYEIDEEKNTINLSDSGIQKAEKFFEQKAAEGAAPSGPEGAGEAADVEAVKQPVSAEVLHYVNNALRANYMMKRDVDYAVVDKKEVVLIDKSTGRLMVGRRLSNGLHQAVEMKEGLIVQNATSTLASISLQNYFRLYKKIAGMTGTAKEEEIEFRKTYGLDVVCIPTNKPVCRKDEEDVFYQTREEKIGAILRDIKACYEKGQPVLIGTTSVEKSEQLSARLKKEGVPHNVLNAINHQNEAEIVAQAGRFGQVTIATNMAGRGTDIMLGGNPDFGTRVELERGYFEVAMAPRAKDEPLLARKLKEQKEQIDALYQGLNKNDKKEFTAPFADRAKNEKEAVAMAKANLLAGFIHHFVDAAVNPFRSADELQDEVMRKYEELFEKHKQEAEADKQKVLEVGGLRVIGTERHDSRRIDNQLRGRSGRQGDVGSSIFYVSMEDDLLRIFGKKGSLFGMLDALRMKTEEGSGEMVGASRFVQMGADGQYSGRMVTNLIKRAQSKVEGYHYSMRKNVLAYDDVMNRQREIIYEERRKVLLGEDVHEEIVKMVPSVVEDSLVGLIDYGIDDENWDYDAINRELVKRFLPWGSRVVTPELARERSFRLISDAVTEAVLAFYEEKYAESKDRVLLLKEITYEVPAELLPPVPNNKKAVRRLIAIKRFFFKDPAEVEEKERNYCRTLSAIEKDALLISVDRNWQEQMVAMEELRNGIGYRALGNKDPVMCYASEGFELFDQMSDNIRKQTVYNVFDKLKAISTPEGAETMPPELREYLEEQKRKEAEKRQKKEHR
ncbi:MAG: preprotein translocase subunit SecA [Clostridia bacterium]|nr:preprotein translocase subunit SecA [Clostridia bacterium]